MTTRTVRDVTLEVLRRYGMTTIFGNPGSTEISFLANLPEDLTFVLALHEGSVVGLATGWALGHGRPAVALLHTTAGFGNAVSALATARVNKAPLVVIVGQQDRRHLASEPFLAGHLEGLAGTYPVWVGTPARATDLPGAIARAHNEAIIGRGPAIVIAPMNDWDEDFEEIPLPSPRVLRLASGIDAEAGRDILDRLARSDNPVLIAGAGCDDQRTWSALARLAERLACPVWQEAFGSRAGFPQHQERFAGHLPAGRGALRETLDGHDLVLVFGAPSLRQYGYEPGSLYPDGVDVVVVTADAAEAAISTADVAWVAPLAPLVEYLADEVMARPPRGRTVAPHVPPPAPALGGALTTRDVFQALASRLPESTILFEEVPSARHLMLELLPTRMPLGFLGPAMGGLGFALPAAAGVRMALPDRPVVALVGDGSSLYNIQALWSAEHYRVGVLYIVLSNGGYAIMDRLAAAAGSAPAWPPFDVRVHDLATAFGCEAREVTTFAELSRELDAVVPTLLTRSRPLLLNVRVA